MPRTCSARPVSSLALRSQRSSCGFATPHPLRGQPAARSASLRACESGVRCVPPRVRSTRHNRGANLWWWLAPGRHAPLRSLIGPLVHRVLASRARAGISSPSLPEGALRPQSCCRVPPPLVGLAPCPLPPVPPPLRSLRSLSVGGCNAPLLCGSAPLGWALPPRCARSSPRMPRASVAQGRRGRPPSLRCAIPPRKGRSSGDRFAHALVALLGYKR